MMMEIAQFMTRCRDDDRHERHRPVGRDSAPARGRGPHKIFDIGTRFTRELVLRARQPISVGA